MATVVAIFNKSRDFIRAVTRLARAGLEDAIYDEGIIAAEGHSLGGLRAGIGVPARRTRDEFPRRAFAKDQALK